MVDFFYQYGLFGLFIAGFLSGSIFPFNSEAVLSLLIYSGFDVVSSLVAATLGNTLGGISIYYLGYLGKMEWIEKYAKVKKEKIHAILPKLERFGALAATLSFVPIIGDIVILALGFFRISPFMTIFFMTIGKIARYLAVIGL
ncbi:MAG TPA: DedA family protein, partial [Prolixibacteraceae bacterium]